VSNTWGFFSEGKSYTNFDFSIPTQNQT